MGADAEVDHGGGLDAAAARFGSARADWVDLSTGINPVPYPVPELPADCWTALPDRAAHRALEAAARAFWRVPDGCEVVMAPGASALIARMPDVALGAFDVPGPTYNEHARAFRLAGAQAGDRVRVLVHPNNPDGRLWPAEALNADVTVVDESFCDVMPGQSHIAQAARDGVIVLKSFGKFWGLAGARLGFAIATRATLSAGGRHMADLMGPWAVSGPALAIGTAALSDHVWAEATRARLQADTKRLDALMLGRGAGLVGGTTLFRLYDVGEAARWQNHLAQHRIWSRVFPYSSRWLRLGLPAPQHWDRLTQAVEAA